MSKIFVSGVAGFLGSHLAENLINDDHQVIGVDNLSGGYLDNIPKKVKFYKADCSSSGSFFSLISSIAPFKNFFWS